MLLGADDGAGGVKPVERCMQIHHPHKIHLFEAWGRNCSLQ